MCRKYTPKIYYYVFCLTIHVPLHNIDTRKSAVLNKSKIEKVPRDVRSPKSEKKNASSFGKGFVSKKWNIRKSPIGRDQLSGGVSVPCRHAAFVAIYIETSSNSVKD